MSFQVIQMPTKTLSWWRDEKEDLDLEPVYQRKGHVWSDGQKQYLIDSILNGFDIPKLYVADFTFLNSTALNIGKKKYAVIDGKQRLSAIYDFFEDNLRLPRGFVFSEDPSLRLAGLTYSKLMERYPRIARKFDNSNLTVMSVITDDEAAINELFVRLNSSKPLTGAELRNAMHGPFPEVIRRVTEHEFFTDRIKFATNRSQDRNAAAKLLLLEHLGTIVDTKKRHLDALAREASDDVTNDDAAIEEALEEVLEETEIASLDRSAARMLAILDRLSSIFQTRDDLLRQPAQIIIIYWLVRSIPEAEDAMVKPFLEDFESRRKANALSGEDAELSEYELAQRTSNDAGSIRYRTQVLKQQFDLFFTHS